MAAKLPVVNIMNFRPQKNGAMEKFLILFSQKLKENGHEVYYLFSGEPVHWFATRLSRYAHYTWVDGAPTKPLNLLEAFRFIWKVKPVILFFWYISFFSPGAIFLSLSPLAKAALVMDRKSSEPSQKRGWRRALGIARGRLVSKCLYSIVSVSEFNRRRNIKKCFISSKITRAILNGVDVKINRGKDICSHHIVKPYFFSPAS